MVKAPGSSLAPGAFTWQEVFTCQALGEAGRGGHKWREFRKGCEIPWGGGWAPENRRRAWSEGEDLGSGSMLHSLV